jgi:TolB-like protein/tetratricopeptide (TPR) repeat protein
MPATLAFGPFELDSAGAQLRKHGRRLRLPPQPFRVLALLAARAGEVVTQEELRREVWGDQTFVEFEQGLYYCLARIRAVLGDEGRAPRYIETVPRLGYRLIVPVERLAPPGGASLAVLPFDNLNRSEDLDYFSDGITDALITELAMLPGLRVISRQSVLRFRRSEQRLSDVARQLDVDHVMEGTVLQDAGRIRVSAQLVQPFPERHVWARSVEVEAGDVIALQRGIVQRLACEVSALLAPTSAPRPALAPTASAAALEKFLKGRQCLLRWTAEGFRTGMQLLAEAMALDPSYAAARAQLAQAFALLGFWGHIPLAEAHPRAKALALEAIRLDEGLSQAHSALGWTLWLLDWDLAGCEREVERAVALNASNEEALIHRAIFRAVIARDRRGAEEDARRALQVDPLSPHTVAWAAWIFVFTRRFDTAATLAHRALGLSPDSVQPHWTMGVVHLARGRPAQARAAWEAALALSNDAVSRGGVAAAAAACGDPHTARRLVDSILAERQGGGTASRVSLTRPLVGAWAALGDMDAAFEELDRALAERDPVMFWVPITSMFDPLRRDRRFPALVRRIHRAARIRC